VETPSRRRAQLTLPSEKEILIVREFDAPKHLVFDAWSKPEYLRLWYGCQQMGTPVCELDFREGGQWRVALRDPTDVDHVFSGEYRAIERPDRLVFTERYEVVPGSDHVVTLTFSEQNGVTTLAMNILHQSAQHRDGHLQSGMEESLSRLDELVTSLAAASA